ncbi:hypothetical protein F5878DRAFT_600165 [Lentinula raphanica]|uniref:Uncharacterized protein n=1 Tax=Lentinula raphanica TaxID=153919 RepID=A0AA38PM22_9AGAR|nr:hypothetical protein F5878DRAFT_600165 [Lentinula raphanica]
MRLPSALFASSLYFPISRILTQSSAALVTVNFNFFDNPATFDVTFEDVLGYNFKYSTVARSRKRTRTIPGLPVTSCNVGLVRFLLTCSLQNGKVNLSTCSMHCVAGIDYHANVHTLSANSASQGEVWSCNSPEFPANQFRVSRCGPLRRPFWLLT